MEYAIQQKIFSDKKQAKYLLEHSHWYKQLNRSEENYAKFLSEYKKHNLDETQNKISNAINTLDTVNTIFKIIN